MKASKLSYILLTAALILFMLSGCSQQSPQPANEVINGITMVSLPGGCFEMGHMYQPDSSLPGNVNVFFPDEQPVHEVVLSGFQISLTEITQGQYLAVTNDNPSTFTGDENLPVTNVGASQALEFCNMLSDKAGFEPCYDKKTGKCDFTKNGFRLPTEAEWEYACKAGSDTHYNTGSTEQDLDSAGWFIGNSGGKAHPIAQKEPNAWGLYDMHGNVFELCYDGYDENMVESVYPPGSVRDPAGFENFNMRIMRGGGWFSEPAACRSFTRSKFWTGGANYYIGFRIVRRP
jgi:formylglycine-generating enzyme required for sulfatase activity